MYAGIGYVIDDITSLPVGIIARSRDQMYVRMYICNGEMFPSDANLVICTYVACQSTEVLRI